MHCVFVKTFDKKEYAEEFLDKGRMLFHHVSFFKGLNDGEIREDKEEGKIEESKSIYIEQGAKEFYFTCNDGKKYGVKWNNFLNDHSEIDFKGGEISLKITDEADVQIFCMTYINGQMQDLESIVETIKGFGEYCVVIVDCGDFLNKISKIKDVAYVRVKYSDTAEKNLGIKRELYKNQSEFRVIKRQGGEKSFETLGKLKGFICSPEDLLLFLLMNVKEIG